MYLSFHTENLLTKKIFKVDKTSFNAFDGLLNKSALYIKTKEGLKASLFPVNVDQIFNLPRTNLQKTHELLRRKICTERRQSVTFASGKYVREAHFYIVKLGRFTGVYLFFLFLLQNIDCGYSLEPPRRGGSNEYPQSIFWSKNKKNNKNFLLKIFNFYHLKNLCILHGHVFVM